VLKGLLGVSVGVTNLPVARIRACVTSALWLTVVASPILKGQRVSPTSDVSIVATHLWFPFDAHGSKRRTWVL
jgi:hypothetical protein